MQAIRPFKIPLSVLVVIHTPALDVLLLRRVGGQGHWQSVTGSCDTPDESWEATARREVAEETGLGEGEGELSFCDWNLENVYPIWPQFLHRYPPGVTINREHVFGLCLPEMREVRLSAREHDAFEWLPWQQAAQRCFSASNAEALGWLPRWLAAPACLA